MKKVIQFIYGKSVYTTGMQQELEQCPEFNTMFENGCIDLEEIMHNFGKESGMGDYSALNSLSKLFYWIRMNRYLSLHYGHLKYSVADIQYVSVLYVMLIPFLTRTFDRIVLSFWGSDLLRQNRRILSLVKLLIKRADIITFPTPDMADSFRQKVGTGYNDKIRIVRFGNYFLDRIDNSTNSAAEEFVRKYRIDRNRTVVVIGYNRFRQQQHLETINSIIGSKIERDKIFIVIPWTYGPEDDNYKKQIENTIEGRYDFVFITEHMSDDELVALRRITDVLISVLTTDALNATMLETMYSGGEVITGSWLKYDFLYDNGIVMRRVGNTEEVGSELVRSIKTPLSQEVRDNNRRVIDNLYRWKSIISEWVALYS